MPRTRSADNVNWFKQVAKCPRTLANAPAAHTQRTAPNRQRRSKEIGVWGLEGGLEAGVEAGLEGGLEGLEGGLEGLEAGLNAGASSRTMAKMRPPRRATAATARRPLRLGRAHPRDESVMCSRCMYIVVSQRFAQARCSLICACDSKWRCVRGMWLCGSCGLWRQAVVTEQSGKCRMESIEKCSREMGTINLNDKSQREIPTRNLNEKSQRQIPTSNINDKSQR